MRVSTDKNLRFTNTLIVIIISVGTPSGLNNLLSETVTLLH